MLCMHGSVFHCVPTMGYKDPNYCSEQRGKNPPAVSVTGIVTVADISL